MISYYIIIHVYVKKKKDGRQVDAVIAIGNSIMAYVVVMYTILYCTYNL